MENDKYHKRRERGELQADLPKHALSRSSRSGWDAHGGIRKGLWSGIWKKKYGEVKFSLSVPYLSLGFHTHDNDRDILTSR
jgi:hypothetical protein